MKGYLSAIILIFTMAPVFAAVCPTDYVYAQPTKPMTSLYINSDTTDVYKPLSLSVHKRFSTLDLYREISGWTITDNYTLSDTNGIVFQDAVLSGSVISMEEFGERYILKLSAVRNSDNGIVIYFNYKDFQNYYCLEISGNGNDNATLKKVISGATEVIATASVGSISSVAADYEIICSNGTEISVNLLRAGEKISVFDRIQISADYLTSGKVGAKFIDSPGSIQYIDVYKYRDNCDIVSPNVIEGVAVTYDSMGASVLIVAFYDNEEHLTKVYSKELVLAEGNNEFAIGISAVPQVKNIKYFLFNNLTDLMPIVNNQNVSTYRKSGLSDELTPYYPQHTAQSLTVDEIYNNIIIGDETDAQLEAERKNIINMYKKSGFDISFELSNWLNNAALIANIPQGYSSLTPKSLTGKYEQPFSVDAPWNNSLPKDIPQVKLDTWDNYNVVMQLAVVRSKGEAGGNGIGIPIIVGKSSDPDITMACKYNKNTDINGYILKAPINLGDYVNDTSLGDRHAVFINDESKTTVQTWATIPPDSPKGYSIDAGLISGFDARCNAISKEIDLSGIGGEGYSGVNAVSLPMNAFTVKASDITDNENDITHAIGGAIGNVMRARVYPALSMDNGVHIATGSKGITGSVPYGGVIRINADFPLEELFSSGKLSLPGYKILKAWRDYGFYHVDWSGSSKNHMLLYTSTKDSDWKDATKQYLCVPYAGNIQGYTAVANEICALLAGDDFFEVDKPSFYVTAPVVKYTDLDVDMNGSVTEADFDLTEAYANYDVTCDTYKYDINKDGIINSADSNIICNFINNQPQNVPLQHTVKVNYSADKGNVYVNTLNPRHGEKIILTAIPKNGYKCDGWTAYYMENAEKNYIVQNSNFVICGQAASLIADRDYVINVDFTAAEACPFNLTIEGDGQVFLSTTKQNGSYTSVPLSSYGEKSQFALKPTAGGNSIFKYWIVNGVENYNEILDVYIDKEMFVSAVFDIPTVYDDFSESTLNGAWSCKRGTVGDIAVASGYLTFVNWNSACIFVRDDYEASGPFSFTVAAAINVANVGEGNRGVIIFGYADNDNYYSVDFNSAGRVRLKKTTDASTKILAEYANSNENGIDINSLITFKIISSSNGAITVEGYQNGRRYMFIENYMTDDIPYGKIGLGSGYLASLRFDRFLIE